MNAPDWDKRIRGLSEKPPKGRPLHRAAFRAPTDPSFLVVVLRVGVARQSHPHRAFAKRLGIGPAHHTSQRD